MLAEVLEQARERLIAAARIVDDAQLDGCGPGARRARIDALLDGLIAALRRGALDEQVGVSISCAAGSEEQERERLRRAVLDEVRAQRPEASPVEQMIVAAWSGAVELSRLRDENARFSALLDAVDDAVVLASPDGRIRYLNRRAKHDAQRLTGLPPDELLGKRAGELDLSPELTRQFEALAGRAGAGEVASADLLLTTEGGERWFDNRVSPVVRPDGSISAIALIGRDVHERRRAQTRLQLLSKVSALVGLESEGLLEAIARLSIPELADWGAVDLVEGERIHRSFLAQRDPARAALRDTLARSSPRPLDPAWWRELRAGRPILVGEVGEALLRERAVDEQHFRLLASLGVRSLLVVPIRSDDRVIALLSFLTTHESGRRYGPDDVALAEELARRAGQILENARLQEELKRSEARFRVALAAGRIAVYEQDGHLRYHYGYNALLDRDVVGKLHQDVFEPDDAAKLDALKRRALEGERVRDESTITVRGERRHLRQAIEPVRDAAGAVVGLIGAATDVTDEKRAQAELAKAVSFREQMLAVLGHDLRNPLTAIAMAVGLLRRRRELPDAAREQVQRIDQAARRMGEMISTLLDFAQARFRGPLPLKPVAADLGAIAGDAVDELRTAWPERRIELARMGDARGAWDPSRIAQVVSNLVANALTHGDGAPIRVRIDGGGDTVRLTVHNTGPPIPPELISELFEPFRRGTDERRSGGLGLGLYIARQIVHAHGGTIEVTSSPGDGTSFIVELPRTTGDARVGA